MMFIACAVGAVIVTAAGLFGLVWLCDPTLFRNSGEGKDQG